jgi:hypothetical protein
MAPLSASGTSNELEQNEDIMSKMHSSVCCDKGAQSLGFNFK